MHIRPQTVRTVAGQPSFPNRFRFGFFVLGIAGVFATLRAVPVCAAPSDSLRQYRLDTLVVSARRPPSPGPFRIVTRDLGVEALHGATTVAQALATEPGIVVRSVGGVGALATLSYHGMDPAETTVLLDGMRMNELTLGLVDLSKLPVAGLATASIGPADATFDDGAGGTLSLRSSVPHSPLAGSVFGTVGAFGETSAGGSIGSSGAEFSGMAGGSYTHATNGFAYSSKGVTDTRRNADFTMRSLYARGSYGASGDGSYFDDRQSSAKHDLFITALDVDQGVPGSLSYLTPSDRQRDHTVAAQLGSQWIDSRSVQLRTAVALRYADETFTDPQFTSTSTTRSVAVSGHGAFAIDQDLYMYAGLRETFSGGKGSDFSNAARAETQALLGPEWQINSTGVLRATRLQAMARLHFTEDRRDSGTNGTHTLATLGIGAASVFAGTSGATIRAFVGTTGRMPTFNDLYYTYGGNPDLRTEHGVKAELGAHADAQTLGSMAFDASGYYIDAHDKIEWLPIDAFTYSPRNVRHVRVTGVTADARWSPENWMTLRIVGDIGSHTQIDPDFAGDPGAGNQLLYVPRATAAASILVSSRERTVDADFTCAFIGRRFTSADNTASLPPVATVDAGVSARVPVSGVSFNVALRCINALDRSYQVVEGYPVPGRALRVTVTAVFGQH